MIQRKTPMHVRGVDAYGSGAFGAPRGSHTHHGIDLICEKGDQILSPVEGKVTKVGYPYDPNGPKGHKRYVEITDEHGTRHRFFYVTPLVAVWQPVHIGHPIGEAQGLQDIYPGITEHVHYEIKLADGGYLDPSQQVA